MFLKLSAAFLLIQLCLSVAVSDPDVNLTETTSFEKRSLGPFDKGSQFTNSDGTLVLKIPPAHFCGPEVLNNVNDRTNTNKYYDTTIQAYVNELQKADVQERRRMIRNMAFRVAPNIPEVCDASLDGQLSRKLLNAGPTQHSNLVATILKVGVANIGANFAMSSVKLGNQGNDTEVAYAMLGVGGALALNTIIFKIIDATNDRGWLNADRFDAFTAGCVAVALQAVYFSAKYFSQVIGPKCPQFNQDDEQEAMAALNTWDAKDGTVRPQSTADEVQNAPNKDACPSNPVEVGATGEVVG